MAFVDQGSRMEWGPVAVAMPHAAARMTRVASADTPAPVRLGLSVALVLTLTTLVVVAFAPGSRTLFAVLLGSVVTVAIVFGLVTAVWTLGLGVVVGTMVLPPTGVPIASDPDYPASVVLYLVEGIALALIGAVAHAAMRTRGRRIVDSVAPSGRPSRDCPTTGLDRLTAREVEVLRLAAGGQSVDDLARELYLSRNTVKTHLAHAYDKLGAHNRADAIACALRRGWLDAHDVTAAALASHPRADG
jgi:DNA-binding CsgD family transcriptional regulator